MTELPKTLSTSIDISDSNLRNSDDETKGVPKRAPPPLPPKHNSINRISLQTPIIPFSALHSQYRASLTAKVTKELPLIPPGQWELSLDHYECVILCSQFFKNQRSVILDDIRPQLNISTKASSALLTTLQIILPEYSQEFLCSIDYRLHLLKLRLSLSPEHAFEEAKAFRERQASLIFNGLLATVLESQERTCTVDEKQMDIVEILDNVKDSLMKVIYQPQGTESEVELQQIQKYFDAVKKDPKMKIGKIIFYPIPLNIRLYELLLRTCFDHQDGSALSSKAEIIEVLGGFRTFYRISESCHEISYTKSLFEIYQLFAANPTLQDELRAQIRKLASIRVAIEEQTYKGNVNIEMENWLKEKLWDYSKCGNHFTLLLGVYQEILKIKDADYMPALLEDLVSMITASEYKQYERLAKRPFNVDSFSLFVDTLVLEVKEQCKVMLPQLSPFGKLPFLKEFSRLYSNEVKHMFKLITNLNLQIAELQTKMHHLETAFLEGGVDKSDLPNLLDIFSPMVTTFISDQEQIFGTFAGRALDMETWEPISTTFRNSSSVVDVFAMIAQMSPVLFSLSLPALSEFFIGTMGGSINRTIIKYSEVLLDCCKIRKDLLPLSANERIKGKQQSKFVAYLKKKEPIPPIPQPAATKAASQKIDKLVIRVNNLQFAIDQLKNLRKELKSKAETHKIPISDTYWENMFVPSEKALERAIHELMRFIATRIVFFDLRAVFIEELYIPNPEQGPRIDTVLAQLDPILSSICDLVAEHHANELAMWVYRQCLEGLIYVIMFGGPDRLFDPKHSELFNKDLQSVQSFFIAADEKGEAQGLQKQAVVNHAAYLKSLIDNLLSYSTEYLMDQYEPALDKLFPTSEKPVIFTKQNILCVLLHRDDKAAKNFMNSQHGSSPYKSIKRNSPVVQDKPL